MRICLKHRKEASEVLVSRKTGEEIDLCPQCEQEIREIVYGQPDQPAEQPVRVNKSGRPPGRPKK